MVTISFWVMLMTLIYLAYYKERERKKEALVVANKEIGLYVNADKT